MPVLNMSVNGKKTAVEIEAGEMLADVLRDRLGLTGTKVACGEGECGSCTVVVDGKAVSSCIFPAMKAQGSRVLTIEGLSEGTKLHPIQSAFARYAAAQCGYCSPGFMMTAKALLDENPNPSREEIVRAISGNLCRCTGYYPIVDAIEDAARQMRGQRT